MRYRMTLLILLALPSAAMDEGFVNLVGKSAVLTQNFWECAQ